MLYVGTQASTRLLDVWVHVFVWKTKNERKWLKSELAEKEWIDSIGTRNMLNLRI
jgi:hypothetical protein